MTKVAKKRAGKKKTAGRVKSTKKTAARRTAAKVQAKTAGRAKTKKKTTARRTPAKKKIAPAKKTAAKTSPRAKAASPKAAPVPSSASQKQGAPSTTSREKVAPAKTAATGKTGQAASAMPKVGQPAPAFRLPTPDGIPVSLADFRGVRHVVLYFYPKDNTSGCTLEACAFQERLEDLAALDTVVIGMSPDSVASHARFRDKFGLAFPLAADEGAEVAKRYGVWTEKSLYGRRYMGIQRATFLIDKQGIVAAVWPKVKVAGHADDVRDTLKRLGAG